MSNNEDCFVFLYRIGNKKKNSFFFNLIKKKFSNSLNFIFVIIPPFQYSPTSKRPVRLYIRLIILFLEDFINHDVIESKSI
jgi:hypothetical protein